MDLIRKWSLAPIGSTVSGISLLKNGYPIDCNSSTVFEVPAYEPVADYTFDVNDNACPIRWVKVNSGLFVADRNILRSISWAQLNTVGLHQGLTLDVGGVLIRLRTPTNPEWEDYIIPCCLRNPDVWHWGAIGSWCSTRAEYNTPIIRGFNRVLHKGTGTAKLATSYTGFRPVAEFV